MFTAFTSNWFIFFPLALSLFVALRLAEGARDNDQRSLSVDFVRLMTASLFVFTLLAIGLRGHPLGLAWLVVGCGSMIVLLWKYRRLERSAMLLTAMQAYNQSQQFTVSESFWSENRGWLRRTAAGLRSDLASGGSWYQSLEQRKLARGVYEKLAVRLQDTYGPSSPKMDARGRAMQVRTDQQRPAIGTVSDCETDAPLGMEGEADRLLGRLFLFVWIFVGIPPIVLIFVSVVPLLFRTIQNFDQSAPATLELIDGLTPILSLTSWGWRLAAVVATVVLLMLAVFTLWLFPQWLQRFPLRWLCNDYFRNAGFVALARALDHEPDLVAACQSAARLVPLRSIAHNYELAAHGLAAGHKPHKAFVHARLLNRRDAEACQLALDGQEPAWCLLQLSRWKMERMLGRYSLMVQSCVVLLTLLLAGAVGLVAVALFESLVVLSLSLSQY